MVFHWCLRESRSPPISSTLLRILVDLNNAIIWMDTTCLLISKSSSSCTLITISITVIFMLRRFFSSLAKSGYLTLFSLSFCFTPWSDGTAMFTIQQLRLLFWLSLYPEVIRWSIWILKSQRILTVLFLGRILGSHISFVHMVTFKLLTEILSSLVFSYTLFALIYYILL